MLIYLLICAVIIGGGYGLHEYWRRKVTEDLHHGARTDYEVFQRHDAKLLDGMDEERFREIYVASQIPRFPSYVLLTVAVFLIGTPVIMALLAGFAFYAGEWGIIPQPGDVATELYLGAGDASLIRKASPETLTYMIQDYAGFYYFFGLLFFWLAVVYVVMRRYHKRMPGSVREEIMRSK